MLFNQILHELCITNSRSSLTDFHITKPEMGFESKENTARAILGILVVVAFRFTRTHGQDGAHIFNEKTRTLIKTNQRMPRIVRQGILIKDIFHVPQKAASDLTDAPLFI
jgi:hypothetical protein